MSNAYSLTFYRNKPRLCPEVIAQKSYNKLYEIEYKKKEISEIQKSINEIYVTSNISITRALYHQHAEMIDQLEIDKDLAYECYKKGVKFNVSYRLNQDKIIDLHFVKKTDKNYEILLRIMLLGSNPRLIAYLIEAQNSIESSEYVKEIIKEYFIKKEKLNELKRQLENAKKVLLELEAYVTDVKLEQLKQAAKQHDLDQYTSLINQGVKPYDENGGFIFPNLAMEDEIPGETDFICCNCKQCTKLLIELFLVGERPKWEDFIAIKPLENYPVIPSIDWENWFKPAQSIFRKKWEFKELWQEQRPYQENIITLFSSYLPTLRFFNNKHNIDLAKTIIKLFKEHPETPVQFASQLLIDIRNKHKLTNIKGEFNRKLHYAIHMLGDTDKKEMNCLNNSMHI